MTKKQQVDSLYQQIAWRQAEIERIQSNCKHTEVLHREFPDINSGWGGEETCTQCGKNLNVWTRTKLEGDIKHQKIREIK